MKEKIIKISSYTTNLPKNNCIIKVALKKSNENNDFKTFVFNNAIYSDGFVSIDNGKSYFLASNFLFHKLKKNI